MIHPSLSVAGHYITTTYCVLLLIVESGDHTLSWSCTTAVFLIPPFLRSSPSSLIALCAPCDPFDSPFCLLRFPYSRGWDLRTRWPLPSQGPRLILPRGGNLILYTRLQATGRAYVWQHLPDPLLWSSPFPSLLSCFIPYLLFVG